MKKGDSPIPRWRRESRLRGPLQFLAAIGARARPDHEAGLSIFALTIIGDGGAAREYSYLARN
jgi:hypothetical protein